MNESTQELATLYVLDKLTVEERKAFEKRLESETQLVLLVRELETAVEEQIRALPQESPPDNLYSRIESLTQPHEPAPLAKSTLSISWPVLAGWGMAAALLLGVGLTLLITDRDLEGPQE
jgi:anti-sigma-K factor RskA